MSELIKTRDSLTIQTRLINDKLSKQLDVDKQVLKEKEANVSLMDYDIKWIGNDSTSYSIEATSIYHYIQTLTDDKAAIMAISMRRLLFYFF